MGLICSVLEKASWFVLMAQMALALLKCPVMEHLNGNYEQPTSPCLMATKTLCVPGVGVVKMACRGSEHTSEILDGVEPKDKAGA